MCQLTEGRAYSDLSVDGAVLIKGNTVEVLSILTYFRIIKVQCLLEGGT